MRASGAVWPEAGGQIEVAIVPGEPATPVAHRRGVRRPADGRRRVFTLVLDCADWRIVQYLRARGELPVLTGLLASGRRAVLHSRPALTAAAMQALVTQ